jgi:HEAT repeat protein
MWKRLAKRIGMWSVVVASSVFADDVAVAVGGQIVEVSVAVDVTQLVAELKSDDVGSRRSAAEKITQHGGDLRAVAIELIEACADTDEEVREWVVAALEELDTPSENDLSDLAELLADESDDVGYWAATLIGRLRKAAVPAVPALITTLGEAKGLATQQRVAWALGKIGRKADAALPALKKAAQSDNSRLSRLATKAIESIGE